jgi:hypothetical protein
MEVCHVLPKVRIFTYFIHIYGIMSSFAKKLKEFVFGQIYGGLSSFAKIIELCQVLSKLRIFINLCQNYGVVKFCQN